jgi:hypothetical protein
MLESHLAEFAVDGIHFMLRISKAVTDVRFSRKIGMAGNG